MSEQPAKPDQGQENVGGPPQAPEAHNGAEAQGDGTETFSRAYVEKLRNENAEHRTKAKRADELATRLLVATVREATRGILADPTDLALNEDLHGEDGFPDAEKITEAARTLVERKPHLGDRRPVGAVEQGPREQPKDVDLAGLLRSLAG